jgi:hypothetical protein
MPELGLTRRALLGVSRAGYGTWVPVTADDRLRRRLPEEVLRSITGNSTFLADPDYVARPTREIREKRYMN